MKKNENYPKYVQAMRLLDDGRSIYYIEKHLGLDRKAVKLARRRYLLGGEIALLSPQHLMRWRKSYMENGPEGLISKKIQMAKKKRTKEELDELEMLRKRNEYLEAENALLKKVRALVEEREARLRAIGQKPSKN